MTAGDGEVRGEVYALADAAAGLEVLDEVEDYDPLHPEESLYVRVQAPVRTDDGRELVAWLYLYNQPLERSRAHPRRRLAPPLKCRGRTLVRPFAVSRRARHADLHGVAREDEIERPIDRHADLALERRDAEQIVRPPQPPRRKT